MVTPSFPANLDPANVKELCENEPWSRQGMRVSSLHGFGTIPEQFEKASQAMPDGSPQQQAYHNAYLESRAIYRDQILTDVRIISRGKSRADLETMNRSLFKLAHSCENDDNYVSRRLIWAAHMVGDWYYKQNPDKQDGRRVSGDDYQQWKIKNNGPD